MEVGGLGRWSFGRLGWESDRLTTKGHVGESDVAQAGGRSLYLLWGEGGDAIGSGKEYAVVLWNKHAGIGNELPVRQAGAADVADPFLFRRTIMPDTHRRSAPDVIRPVLNYVTDSEATESFGTLKFLHHISAAMPDEQPLHRTY